MCYNHIASDAVGVQNSEWELWPAWVMVREDYAYIYLA